MSVEEYMNKIADMPVQSTDPEYDNLEQQFIDKFHECIPTEMLPPAITTDKIKQAIRTCISSNNPDILQVLNVQINGDFVY